MKNEVQNLALPVIASNIGRQKIVNNVIFNRRLVVESFFIAEMITINILRENNIPQKDGLLQAMVAT